jgi:hypothetical protein
MKTLAFIAGMALVGLMWLPTRAQTEPANSATDAVRVASDGVDASLRGRLISVYGVGTPSAIQTWWVIFYDPSVESHGRAVKVENGSVTRSYEAKGGVVYSDALTFAPSSVTGERHALAASQDYAAKHALAYDQVRVLLRITAPGQGMRWRVQLRDGVKNRGFVFVNAGDGTFAMYAPPGAMSTQSKTDTGGGGVVGDVKHAANDVKNTFLGIGGDLQEFFTGDRTVDQ